MFNENNALINSDYEQIAVNTRKTVLDSLAAMAEK